MSAVRRALDDPGLDVCHPPGVALATLMGLDERPAEIAGLGPVLADVARRVAARQLRGAEWRFAVTDSDGYLVLGGITRQRPTTIPGRTGIGPESCQLISDRPARVSPDDLDGFDTPNRSRLDLRERRYADRVEGPPDA